MKIFKNNELFLLQEVVKRNFTSKYKDSVLGILWSVIQPLLIMILLTIIFSSLFGRHIQNFPVYLLSGRVIFAFFNASTGLSKTAIIGNKNILQKIAVPKYIFVLGGIISEFITFLISVVILVGVMIVTNASFYFITMPFAIMPIICLIMMTIGVGLLLSIVCVYYTDIQHLWSVVTLMLMYASAIFYPMDIIPEPYHTYMVLNPFYWIIDQFRDLFVYGVFPDLLNVVNLFLLSLIILIFGIVVFKKYEKRVVMKF